ncbi:DNA polymerase III subunit delta [Afifella sp. IM 167]|uniref:DNA polymerase III subunit delta n=1 Tax=Afifella sp. IM 167 TaxID=2033586 RepID=UPI001CC930D5|nr:DNA polymerase III subunit delta [Afifella sp. IM 167]MBZ8135063.1 DNA polymerase III subunit delta [Afifella sp. IM 167]
MVAVRAGGVSAFVAAPPESIRLFLVYGPDQGAVTERAETLASVLSSRHAGGVTLVRIGSDELSGDPGRISDEANADLLFGGPPLIRLKVVDGRHNVANAVRPLFDNPPETPALIVEAEELRAGNALRKLFEEAAFSVALPCYEATAEDTADLARSALREAGLQIAPDALDYLVAHLGGDRGVTRRELEKLILYAGDSREVALEDVVAVSGESVELRNDRLIDHALTGDIARLADDLNRLKAEGGSPASVMSQALSHLIMLSGLAAEAARGGSISSLVDRARPPVHFRRKDKVVRTLQLWPLPALQRARAALDSAVLETRQLPALDHAVAATTLLKLAQAARRAARR